MGPVHVGIRHDNDLVITELRNIKIVSVAFGKTASESVYHGFYLGIGKDLIYTCLFNV